MSLPVKLQNFANIVSGAAGKERALALKAGDRAVTEQVYRSELQGIALLGGQFQKNGKVLTLEQLGTVPLNGVTVGPKSLWSQYAVDTVSAKGIELLAERTHQFQNGLIGPVVRHPYISGVLGAAMAWEAIDKD